MDPEKPSSAEIAQPLWSSWASAGVLSERKSAQLFCVSSSEWRIYPWNLNFCWHISRCVWLRMGSISIPWLCRWYGVKSSENSFQPLELMLSSKIRGSRSAGKHIPLAREKDNTFTLPYEENKPKFFEPRNCRLDSGVMLTSLWNSLTKQLTERLLLELLKLYRAAENILL